MVVREIRVQAVHRLGDGNGELLRQREHFRVRALDADLSADDEERIFSLDQPSRELLDGASGRAGSCAHGRKIDWMNRRLDLLASRAEGQRHWAARGAEGKLDRETKRVGHVLGFDIASPRSK